MENKQNNNQNKIDIEISQEIAQGIYSNFQIVQHSPSEFIVDFIQVMPAAPKAQVRSRIILSPMHAKNLLKALSENIQRYEENLGQIKETIIPPNVNNINPMGLA
ncbi:MAG: DUF3467 domain-containing protein [Bacteroidales bacterium]|nr:DUF3467 domain-containing protein [Bacteroidales bacterium]MBQ9255394.1 DUF3467 domain-containing protein [Bacteroidales bacterium]MBQ9312742.1 DUF3467 domain-containing protein [Bacteroidales bacterium]